MADYDPKNYWNMKAARSDGDPLVAACSFDPVRNRCIHKVQEAALKKCLRKLQVATTRRNISALDFGCGSGRWSDLLSALGDDYLGIDISDSMIELCRANHPELSFEVTDGNEIPCSSDRFDAVFSIAALHHNRYEHQETLISEISRVLKPGGFLFLLEGIGSQPAEREFPRTRKEWLDLTRSYGYECVYQNQYDYFPFTRIAERLAQVFRLRFSAEWRFLRADAFMAPAHSRLLRGRGRRAALLFKLTGKGIKGSRK